MNTAKQIEQTLTQMGSEEKRIVLQRFFKTGLGEYGEGDRFLGVTVPNIRIVAKQFSDAPLDTLEQLLACPWHECRMCALLILVQRVKRPNDIIQKQVMDFYLQHTQGINNWDLVDLSAPAIVGNYLAHRSHDAIYLLAQSDNLWERRIAIVSTLGMIRQGVTAPTRVLAEMFMQQPQPMHDLMQKATGWMLREMGKRDMGALLAFLKEHAATMPRTMLRYAIERLPKEQRTDYMQRAKKCQGCVSPSI